MKKFSIIAAALVLTACGPTVEPIETPTTLIQNPAAHIVCLQGVEYYMVKDRAPSRGYGFMAPVFGTDSKVKTC